jgi:hypothetical protein
MSVTLGEVTNIGYLSTSGLQCRVLIEVFPNSSKFPEKMFSTLKLLIQNLQWKTLKETRRNDS